MPADRQGHGNNSKGNNQYHEKPISEFQLLKVVVLYFTLLVRQYPELPKILQKYVNENVRQRDMPEALDEEHGIKIRFHP
jgi:hypothetical protein